MQFRSNLVLVLATALAVVADTKYLVIKSNEDSLNDNTLGFPHEGAGINYAFLGTGDYTTGLTFDEAAGTLSQPFVQNYNQFLSVSGGFVALTVGQSVDKFSFDSDNTLLINGTAEGFYACKNTGDPYNYSASSYELMYYTSDAPSDCISVTVVDDQKFGTGDSSDSNATSSGVTFSSSVVLSSVTPTESSSTVESSFTVESTSSEASVTSASSSFIVGSNSSEASVTSVSHSSTLKFSSAGSESNSATVTPISSVHNVAGINNIPGAAGAAAIGLIAALL